MNICLTNRAFSFRRSERNCLPHKKAQCVCVLCDRDDSNVYNIKQALNKLINAVVRNVFFQLSRVKPLIFCLWQEIKEIFAMHFMLVLIQATTLMLLPI